MSVLNLEYQAPQQQIADPDTGIVTREWFLWFMNIIQALTTRGDVFGPGSSIDNALVLWDGATGTLIKVATGTGVVHATSGVYSASDVTLSEIVPATAASRLIGRRSGSAGDWEEVSLGSGLSMSASAVLSADVSADYVVMSDGANPANPVNDGNGNFIYIPYTP